MTRQTAPRTQASETAGGRPRRAPDAVEIKRLRSEAISPREIVRQLRAAYGQFYRQTYSRKVWQNRSRIARPALLENCGRPSVMTGSLFEP